MKKIETILISILLLLGIAHTLLTPVFFKEFNEGFIWFAGTGLSFVFLAFLNISRLISKSSKIGYLCVISNLLATILIGSLLLASDSIGAQGYVSLIVLLLICLSSGYFTLKVKKLEIG